MSRFLGTFLLTGTLTLAGWSGLHAQQLAATVPELKGEAFSESSAELTAASAAMPPNREYIAQILLDEGKYQIAADGTLHYEHRIIYRVDSAEGVKNWSEISASWDPWYEKQSQLRARIFQPDGSSVELDQKTITDAPIKGEDSDTFSSEHVRRAPLPGVAVGSIVEQDVVTEEKATYFSGGSLYRYYFRSGVPSGRIRLTVELPSTTPYKDVITNLPGLVVDRAESDGRKHNVYQLTNAAAWHSSDIDLETNSPDTPLIEFATGASWEDVASTYAKLSDPQTVLTGSESILPDSLPSERMARIRAIVQKLHREIRYTGVEFGAAKLTPQPPGEVIKRHYGDCKDKATLLVAMLRTAGIRANLALLSTGPGRNVLDELPGMNRFNHAIVYVPEQKGGPESGGGSALWIDATAESFEVGTLPFADQGRSALIIAPDTKSLTKTPEAKPEDSVLVETRTFTLAGLGPSHVEETSSTHGYVDASYRSAYGGPDTPRMHDELENYVKNAYLAKKLTSFSHGDGTDFDHPFQLTVVADGARRGTTATDEAVVVIFPNAVISGLPKWFSEAPVVVGPETSAETKHELELQSKNRLATYTIRPFINEKVTRIKIPDGFALRSLPANKTTQLGTGTMTESYSSGEPGIVTVDFRFSSGSSNLSADQCLALRTAVLELNKRDYVGIYFDQVGSKAIADGHIREALEADRKLIAEHPTEALHHVRLARALLDAGIGSEAHSEARRATELDPKSSIAFATLGWTLEHDDLGERFGKGYDLAGAIAALKQAIVLDPDDNDPRFDLAILYEFDARGIRYAADADLPSAIRAYNELIERTKEKDAQAASQYRENLIYALLFSSKFTELDTLLASLPSSNAHTACAIASAAAQHGAAAGIAQANRGNAAASDRNKNLRTAGSQLAALHKYAEAADVISAGIQGGDDAPAMAREIELYRSLRTSSLKPLPATNPASPVQSITYGVMAGTLTKEQAEAALSHRAYVSNDEFERDVKKNLASSGFLKSVAENSDMTEPVMLDLLAGNMTFTSTGDDQNGYAIVTQMPGSDPSHYYVLREDGAYRVIADDHDQVQVGNAVLYALEHKEPAQAKAILDWKRDLTHKEGGDDAFAGVLLTRFWTVGSSKPGADSPEAMRLAAISLLAGSMDAKPYVAELIPLREKASGQRQTDLDLLIAETGVGSEQPDVALPAALRLLEQEPDSLTALRLAGQSYGFKNDPKTWLEMLAPRLAKRPKDHDLLSEQVRAYLQAHDFDAAQAAEKKVLDSGKAESSDYNSFAWLGLFHNYLGDDVTKAAQQSNMLTKNGSFAELHTLACIYAAQGRTTEARQVLKQAMNAGSLTQPDSAVWYTLGLIYEQYGAKTAAIEAFRKVEAHELDDHTYIDPTSTYILAQARIHDLSATAQ
jgi:tetratricopeptide (TPR) repeat protein